MADTAAQSEQQRQQKGWIALQQHVMQHKIDMAQWTTRVATMIFTIGYFLPVFMNPYSCYYKALMAHAATSALRLHQRLYPVFFSRTFFMSLHTEDSCHYFIYALVFLYVAPVNFVLLPVFLFALLHAASFSLQLLDTLGQNSWWVARLGISLIEFQSRNILRLISFTEIFLMPFTLVLVLMGRAAWLTALVYYQFLVMRYCSHRNPYCRNMFLELRQILEKLASKQSTPSFLRQIITSVIATASRLAPSVPE